MGDKAILIKNYDDIVSYGLEQFLKGEGTFEFSQDLDLRIKISGDSWNGRVDYRVADFVTRLQRKILHLHNVISEESYKFSSLESSAAFLKIKVSVSHGSLSSVIEFSDMLSNLAKAIQAGVEKMTGWQIAGTICFVAAAFLAGVTVNKYADYKRKQLELSAENIKKNCEYNFLNKAIETASGFSTVFKPLIDGMSKRDTFEIGKKVYSKADARDMFNDERTVESISETYYIDGSYEILGVEADKHLIHIRGAGLPRRTISTRLLSKNDLELIHDACKKGDLTGTPETLPLWLSVSMAGPNVDEIAVTSIGAPRKGSMTFNEACKKYSEKFLGEEQKAVQLSLLDMK